MKLKESASQTAGPYVHIGLTPNFGGIKGVYPTDLGVSMVNAKTKGQRITIEGRVFDGGGLPLRDALLEIWQADAAGLYNSPSETRGSADPNFTGWGRSPTDMDTGVFRFETVKPGAVPFPGGGLQAPHILFWIVARGINLGLNTRMYFPEDKTAIAADPVIKRIEHTDRVATLIASGGEGKYTFDIRLQGPGETVFLTSDVLHAGPIPLLSQLVGDEITAALFSAKADFAAMISFEIELASALRRAGRLAKGAAERIKAAASEIEFDAALYAKATARDGVAVPELVRQIRKKLDASHHPSLHVDATSQDVIDTSFMMRARHANAATLQAVAANRAVLKKLQGKFGKRPLMARTRMQAALPVAVADRIAVWDSNLQAAQKALGALRYPLQFSGPVGTLQQAKVKKHLAKALHLDVPPHSWQAERSPVMAIGNACAALTGALGKIGADVALMAQNEFAEIKLNGSGTSSAMAHKQNPVSAEILVTLARYNAGLLGTLHQASVHEQERSGAAWTLEWLTLPQMIVSAAAAARIAWHMLENVESMGK